MPGSAGRSQAARLVALQVTLRTPHLMLLPFALQTALQADPGITRVMIERTWLDQVATVGQSLISILVLFMLVAATITLFALRRALDELTRLVKSTSADITGAVHDARVVVEEIRNLSGRVRGTADVVRAGVRRARGFVEKAGEKDEEDPEEPPAIRERPERGERDREPRPPRAFEEQSMADTNRDERAMRKRRRRRRGNDRPPRAPGEERSGGGGDSDAGSGDGPE